jgi:thioredoxin-like negative regulator of GroEL
LWRTLTAAVSTALPGQGRRPTQAEAKAFLARYEAANEAVRQRWFAERAHLFRPDFSDLPEVAVRLDDGALLQAALRIILDMAAAVAQRQDGAAADLVRLAELVGNSEAQRVALARRLQIDPDNAEARLQLAELHLGEGDAAAARFCIDTVLRADPADVAALALRARLGEVEDALAS